MLTYVATCIIIHNTKTAELSASGNFRKVPQIFHRCLQYCKWSKRVIFLWFRSIPIFLSIIDPYRSPRLPKRSSGEKRMGTAGIVWCLGRATKGDHSELVVAVGISFISLPALLSSDGQQVTISSTSGGQKANGRDGAHQTLLPALMPVDVVMTYLGEWM